MAGLPYQKLPAQQRDPSTILKSRQDQEYKYLQSQYTNEARALEQTSMSDRDFKQSVNQLNTKYAGLVNKFKLSAQQQTQQLEQIRVLVQQGNINEAAGREASWRLVLPQETERAMFPSQGARPQSFSMAQMRGAISDSILEFAEGAESDPAFWTRRSKEQKTVPGLLRAYEGWRELIGYDNLNPVRQNQLDMQWDSAMRDDDKFEAWFTDDKQRTPLAQVSALRPTGRIGKAMRDRVLSSASTAVAAISPLGASVKKQKEDFRFSKPSAYDIPHVKPKSEPKEPPSADQLRRTRTPEAYEQGIKLGYWTK